MQAMQVRDKDNVNFIICNDYLCVNMQSLVCDIYVCISFERIIHHFAGSSSAVGVVPKATSPGSKPVTNLKI